MGRRASLDVQKKEEVLEPELVSNDTEANILQPEHLYGPWESGVNKLTSGRTRLFIRDELLQRTRQW
jgi:hypothetical protein